MKRSASRRECCRRGSRREGRAAVSGRHRDGTDDRQAIVAIPAPVDRSFAARCPGSPDDRLQHEAALVDESDGSPLIARFFYFRPALVAKLGDCRIVGLSGPASWLLGAEVQYAQEPVDVRDVIPDLELPLDQLADAGERPQFRAPAEVTRASTKVLRQPPLLGECESTLTAGLRFGVKAPIAAVIEGLLPAYDRRRDTADLFRDLSHGEATLPQRQTRPPSYLKLLLCAVGSHAPVRSFLIDGGKFFDPLPGEKVSRWS